MVTYCPECDKETREEYAARGINIDDLKPKKGRKSKKDKAGEPVEKPKLPKRKNAYWGLKGTKTALCCKKHVPAGKEDEYEDVRSRKCLLCGAHPSYGPKDAKSAVTCAKHGRELGHEPLHVPSHRCWFVDESTGEQCKKQSVFGPSQGKPERCGLHRLDKTIHLRTKYCQSILGCTSQAKYGDPADGIPVRCSKHSKELGIVLVELFTKKCGVDGCTTIPSFSLPGKHPLHCESHKLPGEVNTRALRCDECNTQVSYVGPNGERYCGDHAPADSRLPDYLRCRIAGCEGWASHGPLFTKSVRCKAHAEATDFPHSKQYPKCQYDGCREDPYYADGNISCPLRCKKHKRKRDKNVAEKKCANCQLEYYIAEGDLCEYCLAAEGIIDRHPKESRIAEVLKSRGISFVRDRIPTDSCLRYRPDFLIEGENRVIIVEVDEHQHNSYACECEEIRMINICQDQGGIPVTFIRYNPDEYCGKDRKKIDTSSKEREKILLDCIDNLMNSDPNYLLSVIYLFYDGYEKVVELDLDYENYTTKERYMEEKMGGLSLEENCAAGPSGVTPEEKPGSGTTNESNGATDSEDHSEGDGLVIPVEDIMKEAETMGYDYDDITEEQMSAVLGNLLVKMMQ